MNFYENLAFVSVLFFCGQLTILYLTFWYADHEKSLKLLGYQFAHWYTFLGAYVLLVLPIIAVVNFDFLFAFLYTIRNIFIGKPTNVRILLSACAVPSLFFGVWTYYGQTPTIWAVYAAIFFTAACLCLGKAA